MNFQKKIIFIGFILFYYHWQFLQAQNERGIVPIQYYSTKEYKGPAQNWCVVQDNRGVMYFANNDGVLEFDGASWRFIQIGNKIGVRSLAIDKFGRLYVGGINEFGYLDITKSGDFVYKSLTTLLKDTIKNFNEIWNISISKQGVFFHSLDYIFLFTHDTIYVHAKQSAFKYTFMINDTYYVFQRKLGVYKFTNNKFEKIIDYNSHKSAILSMVPYNSQNILLLSLNHGFYIYNTDPNVTSKLTKFNTEIDKLLYTGDAVNCIPINNNYLSIATETNGIYIIDKQGNLVYVCNEQNGFPYKAIVYQYLDMYDNLWCATQLGIIRIEINSPITMYNKTIGLEGKIEAITRYDNKIFAASNLGIYYLNKNKSSDYLTFNSGFIHYNEPFSETKDILLFVYNTYTSLLIADYNGVFELTNKGSRMIKSFLQPQKIFRSKNNPNRIFISDNVGLSSLFFSNGNWIFEKKFDGINTEIVNISENNNGDIYLGTYKNGLIVLHFKSLTNCNDYDIIQYDSSSGLPTGFVFDHFGKQWTMIATEEGSFKFNDKTKRFEYDIAFEKIYPKNTLSINRLTEDDEGNLWVSSISTINRGCFEIGYLFKDK